MPLSTESLLLVGLAATLAVVYVVVVRRVPVVGALTLLGVIGFVPVWVAADLVVSVPLVSLVALATAVALLPAESPRWTLEDLLMGFVVVAALAPFAVGRLSVAAAFGVVSVWAAGYFAGRFMLLRVSAGVVYALVAAVFSVVGVLAIVEFLFDWHALASWGPWNSSRLAWGSIQMRGGYPRSEGAFGHSIALGASLALAAAMAYGARLGVVTRLVAIALILGGSAVSLSRLGVATAVLGLALCVLVVGGARLRGIRRATVVLLAVGLAALIPWIQGVLTRAGDEAQVSAGYRGALVTLLPEIEVLGASTSMRRSASGTLYFAEFRSIDSQLLLFGLSYGWLTLVAVLALLSVVAFRTLTGRGDPASVAVTAQLPALATVALITQYAVLFWFVLGLAVSAHARTTSARGSAGGPVARPAAVTHPRSSGTA